MTFFVSMLVVALAALGLNLPLLRKPLVVDEGNWFYLPTFFSRGLRTYYEERVSNPLLRPYVTAFSPNGYFDLGWWATVVLRLCHAVGVRAEGVRFFQAFKLGVLCLAAVSTHLLVYACTGEWQAALAAGLIMAVITAVPETLFHMTYGEFGQISSINLTLTCLTWGVTLHRPEFFALAGLLAAQTIHFKPTGWLFAGVTGGVLLAAQVPLFGETLPVGWVGLAAYVAGLGLLLALPLLWLRRHDRTAVPTLRPTYVYVYFILLSPLSLVFGLLRRCLGLTSGLSSTLYTTQVHAQTSGRTVDMLRSNLGPALRLLWPLLLLAGGQAVSGLVRAEGLTWLMGGLLLVHCGSEYLQRAFYTPHFGPFWVPLAVLAGLALAASVVQLPMASAAVVVLLALVVLWNAGRRIRRGFAPDQANMFGYHDAVQCAAFSNAEAVGKAIAAVSAPEDRLLVIGDAPHVYVHAGRECFHASLLFLYHPSPRLAPELLFVRLFRLMPPEWVQWYDWRLVNDWNIERLQEATGMAYRHVHSMPYREPVSGRIFATSTGTPLEFPLYRRDDAVYVRRLLTRAQVAASPDLARPWLEAAVSVAARLSESPLGWETRTRLALCEVPAAERLRALSALLPTAHTPLEQATGTLLLAECLLEQSEVDGAVRHVTELTLPGDPRPHILRGEAAFRVGRKAAAVRAFNAALQEDRWDVEALNGLAVVLIGAGQSREAEALLEKALRYHPEHPTVFRNLGQLWGDKAVRWYRFFLTASSGREHFEVNGAWTLDEARAQARRRGQTEDPAP